MPASVPGSAPACVAATQIAESDVYVPVPQIVAVRAPAGHVTAIRVPAGLQFYVFVPADFELR